MDKLNQSGVIRMESFSGVLKGCHVDGGKEVFGPPVSTAKILEVSRDGCSISDVLSKVASDSSAVNVKMGWNMRS